MTSAEQSTTRRPVSAIGRGVFHWGRNFFALVGLVVVVFWLCFDLWRVISGSMTPTLDGTNIDDGDWVLGERVSYWFHPPRRWDVVHIIASNGMPAVKRVVGVPGETVGMKDRETFEINEQAIEMPASMSKVKYLAYGNLASGQPVPCKDGYYLMGDDSKDSDDSRFNGPVPRDHIKSRAWLIIWPFSRIGFVHR